MGGRGASSGLALYRDRTGKFVEYGTEYKTVLQDGNVKFVQMRNPNDSVRVPEETRTKGRIYVTVGKRGELKCITRYDEDGRKCIQIDLTHAHTSGGVRIQPHSHDTYNHAEGRPLNKAEERLLKHILNVWRDHHEAE